MCVKGGGKKLFTTLLISRSNNCYSATIDKTQQSTSLRMENKNASNPNSAACSNFSLFSLVRYEIVL